MQEYQRPSPVQGDQMTSKPGVTVLHIGYAHKRIGIKEGCPDYFFFFVALGARGAFGSTRGSAGGKNEPGAAGSRVM